MPALTKASAKIEYGRRDVFVSSYPGEAGGRLAEPIGVRIRNNSDGDTTAVRWLVRDEPWKTGELQQWLEVVTDFVLLLDDDLCSALRDVRCEQLVDAAGPGLELLVILGLNDARASAGEGAPVRLWLAKAETLRLVSLRKVGGRADWNVEQLDNKGLLHWLYERDEKILMHQDTLLNKKIVGADETRLGQSVDRFVDHEPHRCRHCGEVHGAP